MSAMINTRKSTSSSMQLWQRVRRLQEHRLRLLMLAHAPACMIFVGHWWALGYLFALHMVLLWGTLQPNSRWLGPVLRQMPVSETAAATSTADGLNKPLWLTIDDGPSVDTPAMLELLRTHDAKATFFLVAERARQHPDLVAAIRAAGHDIGNHSATHPSARFWRLSPDDMMDEIVSAQSALTAIWGSAPRYFRAVAGHANPFVQPVLQALNLQRVGWSARAYDAVDGDVARVLARLTAEIRPKGIVLLHEGAAHGNNVAMLRDLLTWMQAQGYRAVLPQQGQ